MRSLFSRTAVAGAVVASALIGGTAHATPPGPGVTARLIARTTVGDTDYVLREITVPAGQATG